MRCERAIESITHNRIVPAGADAEQQATATTSRHPAQAPD
jgi:hypothetical protein